MSSFHSESPLVSIVIVTYNSAKFVLDTLESAKSQTYQKIELIICDDCSVDNTVEVCRKWISENKDRFVRTEVITVTKNTGVTSNLNRGLKAADGEWLKFIAGDDALLSECIAANLTFISANPGAQIVCSKKLIYQNYFKEECFFQESKIDHFVFNMPDITASKQFELLLRRNYVVAPSVFMQKSLLEKMNGFDERIPMVEDWPMWIKITSAGYKIYYLNKATVKYRLHNESVSLPQNKRKLFTAYDQKLEDIYIYYIYPNLPHIERLLYTYDFKRMKAFNALGLNKNTKAMKLLDKLTGVPIKAYRNIKLKSYSW
ncbi:glycosyltransferase [Cesiribacter sp. SM1]|uniref:glycosyltransferase family 2 protein n=1 Tax=Cesiribacter sp. SM1 TaxID=2861196 RepID=UPI001CD1C9ED|nr:glycosyltransferase [Cesiribacter sp. SM1]